MSLIICFFLSMNENSCFIITFFILRLARVKRKMKKPITFFFFLQITFNLCVVFIFKTELEYLIHNLPYFLTHVFLTTITMKSMMS